MGETLSNGVVIVPGSVVINIFCDKKIDPGVPTKAIKDSKDFLIISNSKI